MMEGSSYSDQQPREETVSKELDKIETGLSVLHPASAKSEGNRFAVPVPLHQILPKKPYNYWYYIYYCYYHPPAQK